MSFSEIELKHISDTVGKMCERRSPVQFRDKLRTIFEVKGHNVTVYEERPHWKNPQRWLSLPVVKFKYVRTDNVWKLYWMRSDMQWHFYEMSRDTKTLEELVKEVDSDTYGEFFG